MDALLNLMNLWMHLWRAFTLWSFSGITSSSLPNVMPLDDWSIRSHVGEYQYINFMSPPSTNITLIILRFVYVKKWNDLYMTSFSQMCLGLVTLDTLGLLKLLAFVSFSFARPGVWFKVLRVYDIMITIAKNLICRYGLTRDWFGIRSNTTTWPS